MTNYFCFYLDEIRLNQKDSNLETLIKKFNKLLQDLGKSIINQGTKNEKLIWEEEVANKYKSATHCHICSNKFNDENVKIKDHDHFTGKL